MNLRLTNLWSQQKAALRDPVSIWSCTEESAGLTRDSLLFQADRKFIDLLEELSITLVISREYENLLISIHAEKDRLVQRHMPVPHPSGVACDRVANLMYVASTRNPNVIYQMRTAQEGNTKRPRSSLLDISPLLVARKKYYPGMYYFHDLAIINGELFANAVGLNGVVKINMDNPDPEYLTWFPKCIEDNSGAPRDEANYIQLNSIAGGPTLADSYFSASGDKIGRRRPGHLNYPVDKRGVIFSGKTRDVVGTGLTRPHSARLYKGKVWVANSGYGEFGLIEDGVFKPVAGLNGWTRGVCIIKDTAFVATSRVIPQYRHYAPGLASKKDLCGLYAISMTSGKILGKVMWPAGNQVFAIDYFPRSSTSGFPHSRFGESHKNHTKVASNYI